MKKQRRWTEPEDRELRKLVADVNLSYAKIGKLLGRCESSVRRRLELLGLMRGADVRHIRRNAKAAIVLRLWREGRTATTIARDIGYASASSVHDILADHGITSEDDERPGDWAYLNWEKARNGARERLAAL